MESSRGDFASLALYFVLCLLALPVLEFSIESIILFWVVTVLAARLLSGGFESSSAPTEDKALDGDYAFPIHYEMGGYRSV